MNYQSWMLYVEKLPQHETVSAMRWVSFFFHFALTVCLYSTVIRINEASTPHNLPHSWGGHLFSNLLLRLHRINRYLSMFFCRCDLAGVSVTSTCFQTWLCQINHWVAELGYKTILLDVAIQSFN